MRGLDWLPALVIILAFWTPATPAAAAPCPDLEIGTPPAVCEAIEKIEGGAPTTTGPPGCSIGVGIQVEGFGAHLGTLCTDNGKLCLYGESGNLGSGDFEAYFYCVETGSDCYVAYSAKSEADRLICLRDELENRGIYLQKHDCLTYTTWSSSEATGFVCRTDDGRYCAYGDHYDKSYREWWEYAICTPR